MSRNHHLKELVDSIKKTDEMITMHKNAGTSQLILGQYKAIKAKQISELIDSLPNRFELTAEMKAILDERFLEDKETNLGAEEIINRLNKKYHS